MSKFLKTFWADESGISSIEYALLLAFIAGGVALAATNLGTAVNTKIENAATCIATGANCPVAAAP
jgi:pilus assembly protein Flp/PilA